jgi:hypothetical protein
MTLAAARALRGNFVIVRADRLRLLLPQDGVGAAAYRDPGGAQEQPVLALSEHMRLLPDCPQDRFLVTPIRTPVGEIAFAWTAVKVLIDAQLDARALPATLVSQRAPLKEFVEVDGEVAFCCDEKSIAEYALANRS